MKTRQAHNSLYFSHPARQALDEALYMFLDIFDAYASQHELTPSQISSFKQLIMEVYLERKVVNFIESKVSELSHAINKSFDVALKKHYACLMRPLLR